MATDVAPAPPESVVALEFPDGTCLARWLCTPERVTDLALGWLFLEGLIEGPVAVTRFDPISPERMIVRFRDENRVRQAFASRTGEVGPAPSMPFPVPPPSSVSPVPRRAKTTESGPDPAPDDSLAGRSLLGELFTEMFERTPLKKRHGGGLHTGAHVIDDSVRDVVEDVSRSAVVDKLVGAGLREGTLGPSSLFLLSGRISATIAGKLARAGIGAAATISVPTDLAVEIAGTAGVSIVGRARRETP
ncbi:MAG: formate dehydrogenase accessory sulfurtransferase FdhD [Gemmatimonadota bacterium]